MASIGHFPQSYITNLYDKQKKKKKKIASRLGGGGAVPPRSYATGSVNNHCFFDFTQLFTRLWITPR